jgi:virginiamycin A acetyltransferase
MRIRRSGDTFAIEIDDKIIDLFERSRIYCDHQYGSDPRRWRLGEEISFHRDQKLKPYSAYLAGHNLWDCGEYSYSHSQMPIGFSCGRYCSISWDVRISGWQHPVEAVTTSLVSCNPEVRFVRDALYDQNIAKLKLAPAPQKPLPKIGNDVWIGMNVTLMSGIEIGDGAIIATGAVVTRTVEPYAIVGGNPARLIRWRFNEDIRSRLARLRWWQYSLTAFADLDFGNVAEFVAAMEQRERSLEPWEPEHPVFLDEIRKITDIPKDEADFREEFYEASRRSDFEAAEAICRDWKAAYERSWQPYDALGNLYSLKGDHRAALKLAEHSMEIAGRTWGHVARVGVIHEELGNFEKAEELLAEAVARPGGTPANPWLQRVRQRVV